MPTQRTSSKPTTSHNPSLASTKRAWVSLRTVTAATSGMHTHALMTEDTWRGV
jgi:hypothetical protein